MAIGRTNCVGGGVTTVDLPTHPESISAASNNQKVIISLTYSDTDYISGVEVRYKTGGYPTSPTDGEGVTAEGAAASIEISGLTNGTEYFFRAYLYREVDGVKYYQTDDTNATVTGIPSVVGINGITPAIIAENYLLIDQSGTFTMTVPDGVSVTAYMVGGGCNGQNGSSVASGLGAAGGNGGKYIAKSLNSGIYSCTSGIGNVSSDSKSPTNTTLKVGDTTYSTSSGTSRSGGAYASSTANNGRDGFSTPYGYIGSSGGSGGGSKYPGGSGGIGAGSGGDGGTSDNPDGTNGNNAYQYGCGGGGAGAEYDDYSSNKGGSGMKGCIIIAWS